MSKADIQRQFDYAVNQVLKQGKPAGNSIVGCKYRTKANGGKVLKCPVGWLIPDSYFKKHPEDIANIPVALLDPSVYSYTRMKPFVGTKKLLVELQYAHDDAAELYSTQPKKFCSNFWHKARDIAAAYGLAWNFNFARI